MINTRHWGDLDWQSFQTIESALEFLGLLDAAIAETLVDVRKDLCDLDGEARKSDAIRLALYKLEKLEYHVDRSKRMANGRQALRPVAHAPFSRAAQCSFPKTAMSVGDTETAPSVIPLRVPGGAEPVPYQTRTVTTLGVHLTQQ